jgi:hypothetical protein
MQAIKSQPRLKVFQIQRKTEYKMSHSVTLSWTASADVVQGYNVYMSVNAPGAEKSPALNGSTLITGTSFVAPVPGPGVYDFVVTSVENGAESVHSNEAAATVLPFPPTAVVISAIN